MYLSSPARTRLALGPGRAVLILGPARVLLVVVMESSGKRSSVFGRQPAGGRAEKGGFSPEATSVGRMNELVATEQAGTRLRRQHCQVTARAHQKVEPAHGQVRIGVLMAHRATFLAYYSLRRAPGVTPFRPLVSHQANLCHPDPSGSAACGVEGPACAEKSWSAAMGLQVALSSRAPSRAALAR